jgi:hypothetical protein
MTEADVDIMDDMGAMCMSAKKTRRYSALTGRATHIFMVYCINMNPQMGMGEFLKKLSPEFVSDHASVHVSFICITVFFEYIYFGTSYMAPVLLEAKDIIGILKCQGCI